MSGTNPGARFADRYVVIEELGGGGMGVVYRARDEKVDRDVAIKVLRPTSAADAARRLRREARAASVLDSTRVAQVYDVGETPEGQLFLVMEYVRGITVRALLRAGRIAHAEALRIVREVALTLSEAHRAGLVHRDVKPDNVIVRDDGRVVLLDFGIVKHMDPSEDAAQVSTQLTFEGTVIGTPAYLAPEQALGREVGPETDQFALAVMAYELFTGKLPWTSMELTHLLAQVLAETPPSASSVDPSMPRSFDAVLSRALSKKPHARFASMQQFADALDAAGRGEMLPSPISETLEGPLPSQRSERIDVKMPMISATGHTLAGPAIFDRVNSTARSDEVASSRGVRWVVGALAGLSITVAGAGVAIRARSHGKVVATEVDPIAALPEPSELRLACPIFEVRGIGEVAGRLGAAAATLACTRAKWYLGGRDDHVLLPAALLDLPNQPVENLGDPYASPEQRARTVDLARARASLYLDGVVKHDREGWATQLSLRTAKGREIAHAEGRDSVELALAIKRAVEPLWNGHPLGAAPIDPEVALWTGAPDVETGLAYADLAQLEDANEVCASLRKARDQSRAFFQLLATCTMRGIATVPDAGAPLLDESSAPTLVTTAFALQGMGLPVPSGPRIAAKLESMEKGESSTLGRALLAQEAGMLWFAEAQNDRAHASSLSAVREDPLLVGAWQNLVLTSGNSGSSAAVAALAGAWFPSDPFFLQAAFSVRTDELALRLTETRLAYLLEPTRDHAIYLGRALAEAGRADEVRALAATPIGGTEPNRPLESFLLGLIDLHDAKLERALQRLVTVDYAMTDRTVLAEVLGRSNVTATAWGTEFMATPDADAQGLARANVATIAICALARRDLATRCLDRVDKLGHLAANWWGDGGDAFLRGAKRYAIGDARGAVAQWRPLVANAAVDIVRLLPTDAFERAGEADLAARVDARKMTYRNIAGVSDAAPREARRAFARGDKARARELAQKVIDAWEVADVAVPAVAEMRALLKSLDH